MEIVLPDYDSIIVIHDVVLDISGGKTGVLHNEVIHSAVHRPITYQQYHPEYDLHTVCAVLLDALARNHAFNEGNKRTALMTMIFTYRINGITLKYDLTLNSDFEHLVLWVVLDKPTIDEVIAKLKTLVEKYQEGYLQSNLKRLLNID